MRRERPSPLDEVRSRAGGLRGDALGRGARVPARRSIARCATCTGRGLPLDAAPIRFGSWIGGDRDGNPTVTPEVTRARVPDGALDGAVALHQEVEALRGELSMTDGDARSCGRSRRRARAVPRPAARRCSSALDATRRHVEQSRLLGAEAAIRPRPGHVATRRCSSRRRAVRRAARLCYRVAARDRQRHHRRRPADRCAPPDRGVRADARPPRRPPGSRAPHRSRRRDHAHLGLGDVPLTGRKNGGSSSSSASLDARPPADARSACPTTPRVAEVLDTFRMMAAIHPESLGAYVITMAGQPSDVLAVELLQREAGVDASAPRRAALRDGARPARGRRA